MSFTVYRYSKLVLFLGDLNLLFILFFILSSTLITHTNTSLHLLLTAELIWITLYALTLIVGLSYDNLNLVSLTFFFLIFSAVEFAVGLVIMLIQHLLTRTINLNTGGNLSSKYVNGFTTPPILNKLVWKA